MATFRQLLLTVLVSGLVAACVVWYWETRYQPRAANNQTLSTTDTSTDAAVTPPPPLSDGEVVAELESLASVPGDESDPDLANAVTDDEIAGMDGDGAKELIGRASLLLVRQPDPSARTLFALGRVALLQGDDAVALKFLTLSANKGYGSAYGYLGDPELSRTAEAQWRNYDKALQLHFTPARDWKDDLEAKARAAIERLAADPQDPSLPQGVQGISNARIMALDNAAIDTLIQDYGFYVKLPGAPAYLVYGLGRAAFLHQMFSSAKEFLRLADQNGSAAAAAYLAYPEITSDLDQRIVLLRRSAAGGYKPGQRMLEDAQELKRTISSAR